MGRSSEEKIWMHDFKTILGELRPEVDATLDRLLPSADRDVTERGAR